MSGREASLPLGARAVAVPGVVTWQDVGLFWVSCSMLFFEILMIRWLSAEIRIFSYFHNLVLLFAFLGIGLGAGMARRTPFVFISFIQVLVLAVLLGLGQRLGPLSLTDLSLYLSIGSNFLIWYNQPELVALDAVAALLIGSALLVFVVSVITVFFIPFGQLLGRLFDEYERPLRAYAVNLLGSLAGLWLFSGLSFLSLPPMVWLGLGGLGCLVFVRGTLWKLLAAESLLLATLAVHEPSTPEQWSVWSPYQKLTVMPASMEFDGQPVKYGHWVLVNSVGYMQITNYAPDFVARYPAAFPADEVPYDHYNIPYRFAERLDDVLIVGAGAGNDTAGALRNGARRVTAVDIDPTIIEIGRTLHPEAPYHDHRVRVVNEDARSFFKKSQERYDLIVFGLLDSHTLSSSYSNVRLDNYVYTTESFAEAGRLLRPDGVMVILFEVGGSDEFIGQRIQRMLADAFGRQPVGFEVRSGVRGWGGTGFVAGSDDVLARRLAADPRLRAIVDESRATHERWAASPVAPATDDWPYLYLAGRSIPPLYFLVLGMLLLFALAGVRGTYGPRRGLDWHFFFLGAGFMLLEVQNISKLALLFGTTWTVNVIMISAILVMILLANAYAARIRIPSLTPYYLGLLASLLVNFALPIIVFAWLPVGLKEVAVALVMGLPIFFAGVVFSTSFSTAEDRAAVFASNLLGAMAGGALESLSFILGVKPLLLLALALYLLAMLTRRTAGTASAAVGPTPIPGRHGMGDAPAR